MSDETNEQALAEVQQALAALVQVTGEALAPLAGGPYSFALLVSNANGDMHLCGTADAPEVVLDTAMELVGDVPDEDEDTGCEPAEIPPARRGLRRPVH